MSEVAWNKAIPTSASPVSEGATRITELKDQIETRMEIDHEWTSDVVPATAIPGGGTHKKISLPSLDSAPSIADNTLGVVYCKSGGLYYKQGTTEIQIADSSKLALQANNITTLLNAAGSLNPLLLHSKVNYSSTLGTQSGIFYLGTIMIQYGNVSVPAMVGETVGQATVTFSPAYSAAPWVNVTFHYNNFSAGDPFASVVPGSLSAAGMAIQSEQASAIDAFWIAIGS